jgi:hypothetical protein
MNTTKSVEGNVHSGNLTFSVLSNLLLKKCFQVFELKSMKILKIFKGKFVTFSVNISRKFQHNKKGFKAEKTLFSSICPASSPRFPHPHTTHT